jgi:23S rRNA pseudouridine1911/1915/1917 synthase
MVRAMVENGEIVLRFLVEAECSGWRLDRYLGRRIPRLSRNRIQGILRREATLRGRGGLRPASRVRAGDEILLRRPLPEEPDVPRDFRVIHQDEHVLALDKPAGLPVHATARYHLHTLTQLLRERYPGRAPTVAHRLDRETSGLLLCGRSIDAARALKTAFESRRVAKRYLCIVHGELRGEGVIDAPLRLSDGPVRIRMEVAAGGLLSRTRYVARERLGRFTLVEAAPETGRQHQIRAHLAWIGHGVVGDKLYPDPAPFMEFVETGMTEALLARLLLPRHALHAASLQFPHPADGRPFTLASDLPPDLCDFVHSNRSS